MAETDAATNSTAKNSSLANNAAVSASAGPIRGANTAAKINSRTPAPPGSNETNPATTARPMAAEANNRSPLSVFGATAYTISERQRDDALVGGFRHGAETCLGAKLLAIEGV